LHDDCFIGFVTHTLRRLPWSGRDQLDALTLKIFRDLSDEAKANAGRSASRILDLSSTFISKQAHDTLSNFYQLYFGQALQEKRQQIDDDVARLVEEAQALMAAGDVAAMDGLQDDADRAQERIGVAHFQKQLEALITVNHDFKERLVPILSSMQFEDAMNQRMSHIVLAWSRTVEALAQGGDGALEAAASDVAASLSSDAERQLYYAGVLREDAPQGLDEQSIWVDLRA
jgi:hypothetical protein